MAPNAPCRYIVWRNADHAAAHASISDLLAEFTSVDVLRSNDDSAVIVTDEHTLHALREAMPDVTIELDVKHRRATR